MSIGYNNPVPAFTGRDAGEAARLAASPFAVLAGLR